jgi:hypothetical protein
VPIVSSKSKSEAARAFVALAALYVGPIASVNGTHHRRFGLRRKR